MCISTSGKNSVSTIVVSDFVPEQHENIWWLKIYFREQIYPKVSLFDQYRYMSETICHTAVQKDPFALGYVIDESKTQGVCKLATA